MPEVLKRMLPDSLATPLQRLALLALAGAVAASLLSIAASQILLAAAIAGAVAMRKPDTSEAATLRPLLLVLLALFLWTVLSALTSSDIRLGLGIVRKFYLFLILPLVPALARGRGRLTWIYRAVFAAAAVSSLAGLLQFAADPGRDLLHRISGFMSQWMTYSGLLMLVLVSLTAYVLGAGRRTLGWAIPLAILIFSAIYLSQTRNAVLGALAGIATVLAVRRPRAMVAMLVLVPVLFVLSPQGIRDRFSGGWNVSDPNTRNRIELFQTSLRLIRDNPWFGVGPKNVATEALRYRGSGEYPDWMYQHMHNNALQIAAERGIPGLCLWLLFMVRLAWDAWRVLRKKGTKPEDAEATLAATGALGCWIALMAAGLFEYNFGDSEVLVLFLFMAGAPYAFLVVEERADS
ncbi:MAG: O-antigen ligase family protein [Acidobacteria bacterium]|nr:O-antigen ligase family protein [Acidobacteriota bacterium]